MAPFAFGEPLQRMFYFTSAQESQNCWFDLLEHHLLRYFLYWTEVTGQLSSFLKTRLAGDKVVLP